KSYRPQISQPPVVARPVLVLTLSLFFMLLAFFIALNGISTYESGRYKPVVKSLAATFSVNIVPRGGTQGPSEAPAAEESILEGESIDQIEGLFNAQITGVEVAKSGRSGILQASVPIDEFERAMTALNQVDLTKVGT